MDWITDRKPTRSDADAREHVIVRKRDNGIKTHYFNVQDGDIWSPLRQPATNIADEATNIADERWLYQYRDNSTVAWILDLDGHTIACLTVLENSTAHAGLAGNVRLMAAAPQMLDALHRCVQTLQAIERTGDFGMLDVQMLDAITAGTDALIAAEGGTCL
jgi:hypothetical protein